MTEKGFKLIMDFEGLPKGDPLQAYWDSKGKVWTIGYGMTFYPSDNRKVQKGDRLASLNEAAELLRQLVARFEAQTRQLVTAQVNPYQLDALTSFCYNCGVGNLKKSTLLKKVNKNPQDPTIRDEFNKWVKSGCETLKGLVRRRAAEGDLYFTQYNNDGNLYHTQNTEPNTLAATNTNEPISEPINEPINEPIKTLTGYLSSEGIKPDNIISK